MNRNRKLMNLQMFATGDNQNQPINSYIPQLHAILRSVFAVKSYWSDFFAPLQVLDGISHKDVAFSIKTDDVAAAVTAGSLEYGGTPAYDTGANVAFGSGTGSTTRFGQRTEVKYTDVDVPYTWDWVYHEGIDKHTVNEDFDAANAKEMEKIAGAITGKFNAKQGAYLSANAGKTITKSLSSVDTISGNDAIAIFNELSKYMVDIEVDETLTKVAAVIPALYNAIVDNNLSTTAKGSDVNIDRNEVRMFKGFVIRQIPTSQFAATDAVAASGTEGQAGYVAAQAATQEVCIAGVQAMGVPFTGIETARAIEAQDFDGTALQGAGKAGQFVSNDNKKALAKVKVTITGA